jgi:hypothetical protein
MILRGASGKVPPVYSPPWGMGSSGTVKALKLKN